jgi:hypothetical protein
VPKPWSYLSASPGGLWQHRAMLFSFIYLVFRIPAEAADSERARAGHRHRAERRIRRANLGSALPISIDPVPNIMRKPILNVRSPPRAAPAMPRVGKVGPRAARPQPLLSVRAEARGEGRERQPDCPRSAVRHGAYRPADLDGKADPLVRIRVHIDVIVALRRRLGGAARARVDRCPSAPCRSLGYRLGACHMGPLAGLSSSHRVGYRLLAERR